MSVPARSWRCSWAWTARAGWAIRFSEGAIGKAASVSWRKGHGGGTGVAAVLVQLSSARTVHPLRSCELFLSSSISIYDIHSPFRPSSAHSILRLHTSPIMLQRTLFRAARQAARPVPRIQPAFAPITRAAPAIRWYSDAAPAEAKQEGEAAEQKEAPKDDAAQLKEQLAKKDKEIVDLKVHHAPRHAYLPTRILTPQ